MCGITGIIQQNKIAIMPSDLEQMNQLIQHRGPDDSGSFIHQSVGLAHRRLSILDASQKGHQPMKFQHLTITFNGEIYNFLELKQELTTAGFNFSTATDTEVILKAYSYWGEDCVQHFNGMWAFAILDTKRKELFCSRDRFGIKPLYYSVIDEKFCLASEIKQFTAIQNWQPTLNDQRAYEFLTYGWHNHTAETFFKDVFQLPQGCNLTYNLYTHQYTIKKYYHLKDRLQPSSYAKLSEKEAVHQFQNLFTDAVRLRQRADVKTGSALSGGLDSSSIVATIHERLNKNQKIQETVSACFEDKRFDESEYIDAVATETKIKAHKVYPEAAQLWELLKKIIWHQDEPMASASSFAQYLVFEKAAKEGLKVMLDGQGADEILAGYDKFYAPHFKKLLLKKPLAAFKEFIQYFRLHDIFFRQIWQAAKPKTALDLSSYFHPSFQKNSDSIFQRSPDDSVQNCSLNMLKEVGLPVLLHYEDRNSMAHSVESRVPFLDYRLVEFSLSLPNHFKIKDGKRKYILRESMKDILPSKVYNRYDKMGFVTPQEIWMEENSAFILEKISDFLQKNTGIFTQHILAFATAVFEKKERHQYGFIWRILTFVLWMQVFEVKLLRNARLIKYDS
jgi:asparagine synthase (glutamine-hydrolysing)